MPPHWGSIFGFLDQGPTANRATIRSRYPAYFNRTPAQPEQPSEARNFNPDFQKSFRSRKPRQPQARLSSNSGTSASLRPSPPLRRSADNRRLCPPKTPRLQSKARPDIITVIIRPRLFRTNHTCPHVTEKTVNQTEKEGRRRCAMKTATPLLFTPTTSPLRLRRRRSGSTRRGRDRRLCTPIFQELLKSSFPCKPRLQYLLDYCTIVRLLPFCPFHERPVLRYLIMNGRSNADTFQFLQGVHCEIKNRHTRHLV